MQFLLNRSLSGPDMLILDRCPTIDSILESCTDANGQLIDEEHMIQGRILWKVYVNIFTNFGLFSLLIVLLSYLAFRACDVGPFNRVVTKKQNNKN